MSPYDGSKERKEGRVPMAPPAPIVFLNPDTLEGQTGKAVENWCGAIQPVLISRPTLQTDIHPKRNCVRFDGANDWLELPKMPDKEVFTLFCIFKPEGYGTLIKFSNFEIILGDQLSLKSKGYQALLAEYYEKWQCLVVRKNAKSFSYAWCGYAVGPATYGNYEVISTARSSVSLGDEYKGLVGELRIYDTDMAFSHIEVVTGELKERWDF